MRWTICRCPQMTGPRPASKGGTMLHLRRLCGAILESHSYAGIRSRRVSAGPASSVTRIQEGRGQRGNSGGSELISWSESSTNNSGGSGRSDRRAHAPRIEYVQKIRRTELAPLVFAVLFQLVDTSASAFERETHQDLSGTAAELSVLGTEDLLTYTFPEFWLG